MVVLEKITAPASRRRAAGGASAGAGTNAVVAAPSGTGTPLDAICSLIVTGTPATRSTALRSCSADTVSCEAELCMGGHRQSGLDDAREHAGADRQNPVVEDVAGIVHGHRAFVSDPEIGAGRGMQHVGEILAAHLRPRPGEDLGGIDDRAGYFRDSVRLF